MLIPFAGTASLLNERPYPLAGTGSILKVPFGGQLTVEMQKVVSTLDALGKGLRVRAGDDGGGLAAAPLVIAPVLVIGSFGMTNKEAGSVSV